ncbi:MAG: 4Fe-4S binding protein [Candidatus Riflebacteria bacterium]|nr:4Fe-4S binding protein [Candidatus Riflebacteria bacterium]
MLVARVNQFFYSPTHTTQKIVTSIGAGIGIDPMNLIENNFTYPEYADTIINVEPKDLVIIGAPVYAGRIAITAIERLKTMKFAGNLAVLVAVYGNRHYDDALIDLREVAISLGLHPLAAAAFVGEHSYSTRDFPIAKGRPDAEDKKLAISFGEKIAKKLRALKSAKDLPTLELPGTFPLPERPVLGPAHAETMPNKCIKCGDCQTACPTGAIFYKNAYKTTPELCNLCCACVKACKRRARVIVSEHIPQIRENLSQTCADRKQPEIFI